MDKYYAHSREGYPPADWQEIVDHLREVAALAGSFAGRFGCHNWAYTAGLWHDVGKFSAAFQNYLRNNGAPDCHLSDWHHRTDHSTAGAQHSVRTIDVLGHLIAYALAGHHGGLPDGRSEGACLESRLRKEVEEWEHGLTELPSPPELELPAFLRSSLARRDSFSVAFFVRIVYSCLVDADFLDTERFMDPDRARRRPDWIAGVLEAMEEALSSFVALLPRGSSDVERKRAEVRDACLEAAADSPGFFTLTVPTGGGKTLSSLAFALRHARRHCLERVVYVAPLTTIIEQNAAVYRQVFSSLQAQTRDDLVIEHHSNLDAGKETESNRLASENWDAPLVVTTSVQFYESLFANRSSRCRKLHNLARAVIILDEAQTLPVDFLHPCLRALQELVRNYGATVILCTATQPAVATRPDFPIGLEGMREIMPDPDELLRSLSRVVIHRIGKAQDEDLIERIRREPAVLCVVNTRSHARALYELLGEREGHFHLSALMCPAHRTEVLRVIRARLDGNVPCRVISTQLVEAGVDIDFPVVYRSLAGLDSIAQAAGRCNRNGRMPQKGRVFVFSTDSSPGERFFADTKNVSSQLLPLHDDLLGRDAIESYFRLYYWDKEAVWDRRNICTKFQMDPSSPEFPFSFGFAAAASMFRIIDQDCGEIIVPWRDEGAKICEELRRRGDKPDRWLVRRLQKYTVQVPLRTWQKHLHRSIELIHDRFPVLISPETQYSESTGLSLDGAHDSFLEA